jgi:uncharacterized peroxidase-related enzyme
MTTMDAAHTRDAQSMLTEMIPSSSPTTNTSERTARISRLRVLEGDAVDSRLQQHMRKLESLLGYMPNWIQSWTLGHAHAARFVDYLLPLVDHAGPSSKLSRADRELLAVVTSGTNGCSYCRFNHLVSLGGELDDKYTALRIALDYRDVDQLSQRQRALADFAAALAKDAHLITDADFERLRGLGLDDETIFEAMLIITMFCAANRLIAAMNIMPDARVFD